MGRHGGPLPRWAVIARAVACRAAGADLKRFPEEAQPARNRSAGPLARARELAVRLLAEHGLVGWEFGFNSNVRRAGVCRYLTREMAVSYSWLAGSRRWRGSQQYNGWNLRQSAPPLQVAGVWVDRDESRGFGGGFKV